MRRLQARTCISLLSAAVATVVPGCASTGGTQTEVERQTRGIEASNVALEIIGFRFGGGVTPDAQGRPSGKGLEIVRSKWVGSAIVADMEGTLLTNLHVASKAQSVDAAFTNQSRYKVQFIRSYDEANDLAVLGVSAGARLTPALLGDSDRVQPRDKVTAVGNTLGEGLNITEGTISQVVRDSYGRPVLFRHTAPIAPGNSGGALYRGHEVIGVNVAVNLASYGGTSFNLAIPINLAKPLMARGQRLTLEEAFTPSLDNLLRKATAEAGTTDVTPAAAGGKPGVWSIAASLAALTDYLIVVQPAEGVDLDIVVDNTQGQLLGYGAGDSPEGEAVALSSEGGTPARISVLNNGDKPMRFTLGLFKVTWIGGGKK